LTGEPFYLEELTAPADGSFFVYSSNRASNGHLFRCASDCTQTQQLTSGASYEIASSCAPDGSWLAYAAAPAVTGGIDHYQLWRMPAMGGLATRLTDFDADVPHISPDGQWVSYVAYDVAARRWQMGVIPATGGAPVQRFRFALPSQTRTGLGAPWTHDGKALTYLVTQKFVSNVWAQPLDGGAAYPLTNFTSGLIYRYAFSRDGQTLYLARGYPTNDAVLIRNFR
jgi:Tol biopolymer transport system component